MAEGLTYYFWLACKDSPHWGYIYLCEYIIYLPIYPTFLSIYSCNHHLFTIYLYVYLPNNHIYFSIYPLSLSIY